MGGDTNKSTTTTGSSSQAVTDTTNKLLTGLSSQYDKGTAVNPVNLYSGAGDTTKNAWASMLGAANNPGYSDSINAAIGDFGQVAAGNRFGENAPGYATLRKNALDDALGGVGSAFQNNGRFGSSVMGDAAGTAATNAIAGLDYNNYQNDIARQQSAAQALPGLYNASLAPSSAMGSVGAAQDANTQGLLQGANDLFRRQNDAGWSTLGQASSILGGTAGNAGTTSTTQTPTTPWWQSAIGIGLGLA